MKLDDKLFELFGYKTFFKGQKEVISKVINNESAIAIFPTGSGKSLCYQLPAQILPGVTLVISPLLALMKDQIEYLSGKNIPAAKLDSTMNKDEYNEILRKTKSGKIKILMISIERFKNERFRLHLKNIPVSLLVVDEAHCISEWGHNFRPDYLKIPIYQKEFNIKQVLLLTATATPFVVNDMCEKFGIMKKNTVITGFYRNNLHLQVSPVSESRKNDILLKRLSENPAYPAIVYVTLQKTAEEVSSYLNSNRIKSLPYHAGLKDEQREKIQNKFMRDEVPVIVATIAFGMGIDKKNIRKIIHYDMPKSIEGYSQEIGRSGRDGKKSVCETFVNRDNIHILENFVYGDTPEKENIKSIISEIKQHQNNEYEVSLVSLSGTKNIRLLPLKTLFVYLEMKNIIQPKSTYYKEYKFKFKKEPQEIINSFKGERKIFVESLINHGDSKKIWTYINIDSFIHEHKSERTRVISALEYFDEKKWIELHSRSAIEVFSIIDKNFDVDLLSDQIFQIFKHKESKEIERISDVFKFFEQKSCLSAALADYFGERISQKCGHCSHCSIGRLEIPKQSQLTPLKKHNHTEIFCDLEKIFDDKITVTNATRFLCGISTPFFFRFKADKKRNFGVFKNYPYQEVESWVASHIPG